MPHLYVGEGMIVCTIPCSITGGWRHWSYAVHHVDRLHPSLVHHKLRIGTHCVPAQRSLVDVDGDIYPELGSGWHLVCPD